MARATLTKTTAPGAYAAAAAAVTMTAANVSDKNQFRVAGADLIIVQNSGATQRTFTINSSADSIFRRTQDITAETIDAGVIKVFGPVKPDGWIQSDGYVYLEANNADVKFGVVAM